MAESETRETMETALECRMRKRAEEAAKAAKAPTATAAPVTAAAAAPIVARPVAAPARSYDCARCHTPRECCDCAERGLRPL